jgi:hypothetical protein
MPVLNLAPIIMCLLCHRPDFRAARHGGNLMSMAALSFFPHWSGSCGQQGNSGCAYLWEFDLHRSARNTVLLNRSSFKISSTHLGTVVFPSVDAFPALSKDQNLVVFGSLV